MGPVVAGLRLMSLQMMGRIYDGIAQTSPSQCLSPTFLLSSMPPRSASLLSLEPGRSSEPYRPSGSVAAFSLQLQLTKINSKITSLTADLAAF